MKMGIQHSINVTRFDLIYKHNYQLFTLKMLFKMTTLSKICSKFPYSSGSDRNFPCSSVDLIVQIINLCVRVVVMQGELGRGSIAWESWDEKYKDWKRNKYTSWHIIMQTLKQWDLGSWRGGIAWEKRMQKYKDKKALHVMYGDLGRGNVAALHGR